MGPGRAGTNSASGGSGPEGGSGGGRRSRPPRPGAPRPAAPPRDRLYQREQRSSVSSRLSAARLWAQAPPAAGSMAGAGRGWFPERTLRSRFPGIAPLPRKRLLGERGADRMRTPSRTPPACEPSPAPAIPGSGRRDARGAGQAVKPAKTPARGAGGGARTRARGCVGGVSVRKGAGIENAPPPVGGALKVLNKYRTKQALVFLGQ